MRSGVGYAWKGARDEKALCPGRTTLTVLCEKRQEALDHTGSVVQAVVPVKTLRNADAMLLKEPVPCMVIGGAGVKWPIYFEHAPLAVVAHEKVGFAGCAAFLCAESSQAVW